MIFHKVYLSIGLQVFEVSEPKFTGLFSLNAGGIAINQLLGILVRFWISFFRSGDIRRRSL